MVPLQPSVCGCCFLEVWHQVIFHFDSEIAEAVGVDQAVVIECLRFWIAKNRAEGRNLKVSHADDEPRTWTFNSIAALTRDFFPFWNADKVRRILDKLRDSGLILAEDHAKEGSRRPMWYAFRDEELFLDGIQEHHLANLPKPFGKSAKCHLISQLINSSCKYEKRARVEAIPETAYPFEDFWNLYGVKSDRNWCERKWGTYDEPTRAAIMEALPAYVSRTLEPGGREGTGRNWKARRRLPRTYLNNENWKDSDVGGGSTDRPGSTEGGGNNRRHSGSKKRGARHGG